MADGKVKIQIETNAEKASYDMKKLDKSLQDVKNSGQATVSQNSILEGSMDKLKTQVTRLIGAYVGLKGIKAVTSYIVSTNEAFKVQERAILSLNNALMNSGSYTYEYSQHLQQLASDIQSYSNYGDEATEKAIALGQAFMGNVRMTDELIKATVDFAAATGKDLDSAFTLVGKSIGSSTNALGRYGIELDKNMTDSQKMEAIITQLGNRYEGSAQKMADSSVQLKNAMGDLGEAIGAVFNPAIEAAERALVKLAKNATNAVNQLRVSYSNIKNLDSINDLETKLKQIQEQRTRLYKGRIVSVNDETYRSYTDAENEIRKKIAQLNAAEKQNAIQSQAKGYKMRDDDFSAPTKSSSSTKKIKDEVDLLYQKAEKAKRSIQLLALQFGSSSPQVQKAYTDYKNLNQTIENMNSVFKEQIGPYDQLQEKISKLAEKLRDLATAGQTSTDEFNNALAEYQTAVETADKINKDLEKKLGKKFVNTSKTISDTLSGTLVSSLRDGGNAFQAFGNLAESILEKVISKMLEMAVIKPLVDSFSGGFGGSILSFLGFAKHGMAIQNGVQKFANGGVVNSPTLFPMRSGMGLMGEAGAEAIMPLKRNANGDLGVQATAPQVTVNNYTNSAVEVIRRPDNEMEIKITELNAMLSSSRTNRGMTSAQSRLSQKGRQIG